MALRRRPGKRANEETRSELFPGFIEVVEIGAGSLATVYRAREASTQRPVALKLLNVRDASPRAIESFQRESVALGALSSHPNIVTLYRTFQVADGRPVLVLELCVGSIADQVRNGAGLPVPEAVSVAIKTAGALETAHRAGILHRDVKPQNILITEFGEPALADFGVAMLQSSTQTTAGLFDFTTLHAAPELLEGGQTSAATDVYELASTLYQLIAGQSAFRAYDGESPASVILRILRDPVRPVLAAGVPVQLSDLLIWAMSKEKDERPPSAAEFAAELARVEVAQGWPRTQFLIRDSVASPSGGPAVSRLPDAAPTPIAPLPVPADPSAPAVAVPAVAAPVPTVPASTVPVPTAPPLPAPGYPRQSPPLPVGPPPLVAAPPPPRVAGPTPYPIAPLPPTEPPRTPFSEVPAALRPPLEPGPGGDLSIDPTTLHRKLRLSSGGASLRVDDAELRLRSWFHYESIAWVDVLGFEPQFDARKGGAASHGSLVVLTTRGRIELPATRGPIAALRDTHALLDAYRVRAAWLRGS